MYYQRKRNVKRKYTYGGGLFDSIIAAVTSQATKEVVQESAKQVAKKALTETGNRLTQKAVNKILPPTKKGASLNNQSIQILQKYGAIPIEEYVRKF